MKTRILETGAKLLLCTILLIGCNGNEENQLDYSKAILVKIACVEGKQEKFAASSLFDSVVSTMLHIDSNTLISKIDKVFFVGDTLIIVDQRVAKRIMAFSNEGNLLFEFRNINNTPFTDLQDIVYNKDQGLLEVFDATRNRIVSYDIRSGVFVKERKCRLSIFSFYYLGANTYAYYTHFNDQSRGSIKHNLVIEDSSGIFKRFLPYYENEIRPQDVALNFKPFFTKSGKNYFAPNSSKYIYEITQDNVIPFANLDFGGAAVDVYGGLVKQQDIKSIDSPGCFAGDAFILGDSSLYFTYKRGHDILGCLHSTQKSLPNILQLENDINEFPLYTDFIAQTDSFIVQAIDLEELNASAERYKYVSKEFYNRTKSIVDKYPAGSFIIKKLYLRQ